jgi:hypothetical protein
MLDHVLNPMFPAASADGDEFAVDAASLPAAGSPASAPLAPEAR